MCMTLCVVVSLYAALQVSFGLCARSVGLSPRWRLRLRAAAPRRTAPSPLPGTPPTHCPPHSATASCRTRSVPPRTTSYHHKWFLRVLVFATNIYRSHVRSAHPGGSQCMFAAISYINAKVRKEGVTSTVAGINQVGDCRPFS